MKDQKILSNAEIASFCSQTAMLFRAGIAPAEGMRILVNDAPSKEGKALLQAILDVCRQGESFYTALESTGVFPDYVLNMIRLGEESGSLDDCMQALADYYDKEEAISDSVKNAVTYPFIMIAMMLVVIVVLISRVMPIFEQVFEQLGSEMTGIAGSLLNFGNSLNRYSVVLLVILCVIAIVYLLATRTGKGRQTTRRFLTRFPLTRGFYESVACERFASGMALTLSSGLDTFTGLDMVSRLVDDASMQTKIDNCKASIRSGSNFAEALTSSGIFNNLYSQMIAVGARSGNVDEVLSRIADNYEKETDKRIQNIISVLEPTLVIILSVIVGMILLSVILPLMGIMSSIG